MNKEVVKKLNQGQKLTISELGCLPPLALWSKKVSPEVRTKIIASLRKGKK